MYFLISSLTLSLNFWPNISTELSRLHAQSAETVFASPLVDGQEVMSSDVQTGKLNIPGEVGPNLPSSEKAVVLPFMEVACDMQHRS
jgi:hypothetical protein